MNIIKVVIVEDSITDIKNLLSVFNNVNWIKVTRVFTVGHEFIQAYDEGQLKMDVLLLDYKLPDIDGLHVLQGLKPGKKPFKVLMMSHGFYSKLNQQLKALGQNNYIRKSADRILDAIPLLMENKSIYMYDHELSEWEHLSQRNKLSVLDEQVGKEGMTPLEVKIIRGLALGKLSSEIALSLGYESSSIDKYRGLLLKKVGVRNTHQLIAWAILVGIVSNNIIYESEWTWRDNSGHPKNDT